MSESPLAGASPPADAAWGRKRLPIKTVLLLLPFAVLGVTRAAIEVSVRLLPTSLAWMLGFLAYYAAIEGAVLLVRSRVPGGRIGLSFGVFPLPGPRLLIFGVLLPALLPFGFFVLNVRAVPAPVLLSIAAFALMNPPFEETFWRGVLALIPVPDGFRILYSGFLFGLSHWFLWGSYWLTTPRLLIPVVATTFVMGVAWMWLYLRVRTLLYPILSHVFVDIFNLSVAMFLGLRLVKV